MKSSLTTCFDDAGHFRQNVLNERLDNAQPQPCTPNESIPLFGQLLTHMCSCLFVPIVMFLRWRRVNTVIATKSRVRRVIPLKGRVSYALLEDKYSCTYV